jgi:hypothetical protein
MVQRRNNFTGILTEKQAKYFASLISSAATAPGFGLGAVRINHKGDGETVKEYLKYFGSKYPYSSISRLAGYCVYYCKDIKYSSRHNQAIKLTSELNDVIRFGRLNGVNNPSDEILIRLSGGGSGSNYSIVDNDRKEDKEEEKSNVLLYVGIGAVAFLIIFLILKKRK